MRHLVLVSLLVLMVTFSAGCALSRSGSSTVSLLRGDASAKLKQLMERSTDTETESSSELVQSSFTKEADGDSAAFPIETDEELDQPEWWTAGETNPEAENLSSTELTLTASSTTNVTTSNQTEAWKPAQGWTATQTR